MTYKDGDITHGNFKAQLQKVVCYDFSIWRNDNHLFTVSESRVTQNLGERMYTPQEFFDLSTLINECVNNLKTRNNTCAHETEWS